MIETTVQWDVKSKAESQERQQQQQPIGKDGSLTDRATLEIAPLSAKPVAVCSYLVYEFDFYHHM